MRRKIRKSLSGLLAVAMLASALGSAPAFSSSDVDQEPQEAVETVAETAAVVEAPQETYIEETAAAADTEQTVSTEADSAADTEDTEAAGSVEGESSEAEAVQDTETADTEAAQETDTDDADDTQETETDSEVEEESETESETEEVRKNVVTFDVAKGAVVEIGDTKIKYDSDDKTDKAVEGKIVFTANAEEGYEITQVLVDGITDARKNEETVDELHDYIIEGILTDNTVVTVKTRKIEQVAQTAQSGDVVVKAAYTNTAFAWDENVTLRVEEIYEGTAAYAEAESALEGTVDYDGMRAFDICFVNAEGTEVEPASAVSVSIEAVLDTEEEIAENSVQITHIDESTDTPQVVAAEAAGTVDVDDTQVAAEFTVESFSTFTLTWNNSSSITLNIICIDEQGNEIGTASTGNISSATAVSSIAPTISGYTFSKAVKANSASSASTGTTITQLRYNSDSSRWNYYSSPSWYYWTSGNVYFIYTNGTTYSGNSVDHIDIAIKTSASLTINGETLTEDNSLEKSDIVNGHTTLTATWGGSPVSYTWDISSESSISTSSGSNGASQYRISGTYPIGTVSNPVTYTLSLTKDVTFTDSNGKTYTVACVFTSQFSYWDGDNNCPGLPSNWSSMSDSQKTYRSQAGMDFDLSAASTSRSTLTIWKYVTDKDGEKLTGYTGGTINFDIYKSDGTFVKTVTVTVSADGLGYYSEEIDTGEYYVVEAAPTQTIGNYVYSDTQTSSKDATKTTTTANLTSATMTASGTSSPVYTYYNRYEPATKNLTVNKVWSDNDNQDGKRTASVTVQLFKNGVATGDTKVLSAENNWEATFEDLAISDSNGSTITYSVQETAVTGYTTTYSLSSVTLTDGDNAIEITNTHTPEKISIPVTKTWVDLGDNDPDRQAVTIYAYDAAVYATLTNDEKNSGTSAAGSVTISASPWTGTIADLPKYEEGKVGEEITYVLHEAPVENYSSEVSGDATNGFNVTNTKNTITFTVQKTVTGNMGDKTKKFNITVTSDADMTVGGSNVGQSYTAQLADTETITVTVMKGANITVAEDNYKDQGYTTTYTYTKGGATTAIEIASAASTSVDNGDLFTVINYKNKSVDTGIDLDTLPYMLTLLIVLIGGFAFFVSRRRRYLD